MSFLRKFEQGDRFLNMTNIEPIDDKGNPLNINNVFNIDGLLLEPVSPGLLISNKRFILNDTDRPLILGRSSHTNFNGIDR